MIYSIVRTLAFIAVFVAAFQTKPASAQSTPQPPWDAGLLFAIYTTPLIEPIEPDTFQHAFVRIFGETTGGYIDEIWGFRAARGRDGTRNNALVVLRSLIGASPGQIGNFDPLTELPWVVKPITRDKYLEIRAEIDRYQAEEQAAPTYNVFFNNCLDFTNDLAEIAGLEVPNTSGYSRTAYGAMLAVANPNYRMITDEDRGRFFKSGWPVQFKLPGQTRVYRDPDRYFINELTRMAELASQWTGWRSALYTDVREELSQSLARSALQLQAVATERKGTILNKRQAKIVAETRDRQEFVDAEIEARGATLRGLIGGRDYVSIDVSGTPGQNQGPPVIVDTSCEPFPCLRQGPSPGDTAPETSKRRVPSPAARSDPAQPFDVWILRDGDHVPESIGVGAALGLPIFQASETGFSYHFVGRSWSLTPETPRIHLGFVPESRRGETLWEVRIDLRPLRHDLFLEGLAEPPQGLSATDLAITAILEGDGLSVAWLADEHCDHNAPGVIGGRPPAGAGSCASILVPADPSGLGSASFLNAAGAMMDINFFWQTIPEVGVETVTYSTLLSGEGETLGAPYRVCAMPPFPGYLHAGSTVTISAAEAPRGCSDAWGSCQSTAHDPVTGAPCFLVSSKGRSENTNQGRWLQYSASVTSRFEEDPAVLYVGR